MHTHRVSVGMRADGASDGARQRARTLKRAACAAIAVLVASLGSAAFATSQASAATLLYHSNIVYGIWPPPGGGVIGPTRPLTQTSTRWEQYDAACTGAANLNNNPVGNQVCSWDVAVHPYDGTERRPWAGSAALWYYYSVLKARVDW